MAPGRTKRNGVRLSTELGPIGVTTEKADELVQLYLHALGNKDINIKLKTAMGSVPTARWVAAESSCVTYSAFFLCRNSEANRYAIWIGEIITWPADADKQISATVFQRTSGRQRIIGAIDGCHIRILRSRFLPGHRRYVSIFFSFVILDFTDFIFNFVCHCRHISAPDGDKTTTKCNTNTIWFISMAVCERV